MAAAARTLFPSPDPPPRPTNPLLHTKPQAPREQRGGGRGGGGTAAGGGGRPAAPRGAVWPPEPERPARVREEQLRGCRQRRKQAAAAAFFAPRGGALRCQDTAADGDDAGATLFRLRLPPLLPEEEEEQRGGSQGQSRTEGPQRREKQQEQQEQAGEDRLRCFCLLIVPTLPITPSAAAVQGSGVSSRPPSPLPPLEWRERERRTTERRERTERIPRDHATPPPPPPPPQGLPGPSLPSVHNVTMRSTLSGGCYRRPQLFLLPRGTSHAPPEPRVPAETSEGAEGGGGGVHGAV